MTDTAAATAMEEREETALRILLALSFCHMLNDMIQSLLPAIYPILKDSYTLSFTQVGLITLTFQMTASLLQPMVGFYTDKRPKPFSLPVGMAFTLSGLLVLAYAASFHTILLGAALVGTGSSVFHPESSRMARTASGGKHGFAQSLFQVGGNFGTSLGPLLAAFVILPHGQRSIAWFSLAALLAITVLSAVCVWYKRNHFGKVKAKKPVRAVALSHGRIAASIIILLTLVFSKLFYMASFHSYYTFYLMQKFGLGVQGAQIHLFLFLGAVAAGTLAGGPVGDRIGRKPVIWISILGVLPFTLALPYANLLVTEILSVVIGLVIASAFSAIIVYAQELAPGRVGMISGLFYGFAFGMAGIGAATLGILADHTSLEFVYQVTSYLPALGILCALLPDVEGK